MLQLDTLEDRRDQLFLKFAKSCQKYPKFGDIYPKNIKTHQMELRNPKRERFRKSAIITMQHLIKYDAEKKNDKEKNKSESKPK